MSFSFTFWRFIANGHWCSVLINIHDEGHYTQVDQITDTFPSVNYQFYQFKESVYIGIVQWFTICAHDVVLFTYKVRLSLFVTC